MTTMLRRLLRLSAVEDVTGMAKPAIYDAMERGVFPKPVPILEGGRAVGWVEEEIIDYIDARIALRNQREALRGAEVEPERRPRGRPRKRGHNQVTNPCTGEP
jgi:prophage regulatory protein